jgi:hypothetical protein
VSYDSHLTGLLADFIAETARITAAGGFVEFGRVNGKLWNNQFSGSAKLTPQET